MGFENLAKGTSTIERYELLKNYYSKKETVNQNADLSNYHSWRSRPTMVTDERFEEILNHFNLTKEEFNLAIKPLTEEEKKYIYNGISQEDWVSLTTEILKMEDTKYNDIYDEEKANFTYVLRLHISYFDNRIKAIVKKFPELALGTEAIESYVRETINRFMDLGLRTFVYDLHEKKELLEFSSEDEKERFREYLKASFFDKAGIVSFFTNYPVLARLYAQTIQFQLTNFTELLQALTASAQELADIFEISLPLTIKDIQLGAGDSHDNGKTVAILHFDKDKKLVYKPKNLEVGRRFDAFIKTVQELDSHFDFYLTTKLVKEAYTFEEYLKHQECLDESEIQHYYKQFGHTIALVYLLNGNDFHLENVLAYGKYPVLIDLETIIQNHFPMPDSQNAIIKVMEKNGESVVMSGLVPIYLFEEKADEEIADASQGVQLSALSGDKQKLPYKILKLINFDSDNMQFVYEEHFTDGAENIPMFQGEKIDFVPYIKGIVEGFQEFCQFALEHKEQLAAAAEELFSDILVRNVIKTTQSYIDLLEYSTHPSCMVDYIEREKLFENLWMHSYANSKPVPYEVRDMLQHDVPIFFNPTGTSDLMASQGEIIKDMYRCKSIDLEIKKITEFSKQEENEQLDYLKTSFGLYHSMDLQETTVQPIPEETNNFYLEGGKAIGQAILEAAFIGEDSIAWRNIEENSPENYLVHVMDENLYDGITGMYLFFSELYHLTRDEDFKEPYQLAEKLVILLKDDYIDSISALYGSFSAVYPLLYTYKQTGEARLLKTAEDIAQRYLENDDNNPLRYDWNGGVASIIRMYVSLYEITNKEHYLKFAKKLLMDIPLSEIHQGGFAHGYSGVIYAANSIRKINQNQECEAVIRQCLELERQTFDDQQKGWLDIRMEPPMVNDLWCYGATGIGMAYLDLWQSGFEDNRIREELDIALERILKQEKRDDCLCHGNFGDFEFLLEIDGTSIPTLEQKKKINKKLHQLKKKIVAGAYTFEGLPTIPKYGMFTGLAGIGHQLLRLHNPQAVTNILTLELPKA